MLDKVSRYRREEEIAGSSAYVNTIIIVDKIGRDSRVEAAARKIAGRIIQMSASYWPQEVARELHNTVNFEHPLLHMPDNEIENYLREKLELAPIEQFIKLVKVKDLEQLDVQGTEPAEQVELPDENE